MADKNAGRFTFLKPARAVYCNVLEARKFKDEATGQEKGEAKFDISIAVKPEDLSDFGKAIRDVATAKWPGRALGELRFPYMKSEDIIARTVRMLTRKGKSEAEIAKKVEGLKARLPVGHYIIKAASKFPVTVSRFVKGVPTAFGAGDAAEAKKAAYAGCWVIPIINLVPYVAKKDEDKDGITAYLDQVLIVAAPKGENGDRLGGTGTQDPKDAFKAYMGSVSGEDPTGGTGAQELEDIIPF